MAWQLSYFVLKVLCLLDAPKLCASSTSNIVASIIRYKVGLMQAGYIAALHNFGLHGPSRSRSKSIVRLVNEVNENLLRKPFHCVAENFNTLPKDGGCRRSCLWRTGVAD